MYNMSTGIQIATTNGKGGSITMSSREIAELTGKRHNHILRDIERMVQDITEPKFGLSDFETTYKDATGRSLKEYRLPKDLTVTLVTGYRADLRYKVVKKLEELESRPQMLDFSNPAVVLGVIGHLQEQVQVLEGRSNTLTRLESAKGSMCITDAAKTLGVTRTWLFDFMSSRRWIFKRSGNKNWLAYDDKRKSLLLEHDDHLYMDDLGQERVSTRVLVTAKGLVKLAELIEQPLH